MCAESHMTGICTRASYLLANMHHMSTSKYSTIELSLYFLQTYMWNKNRHIKAEGLGLGLGETSGVGGPHETWVWILIRDM